MRAIVSKELGEAQALEADEHPFEWKGPDEIFAIYKVSNLSIHRPCKFLMESSKHTRQAALPCRA